MRFHMGIMWVYAHTVDCYFVGEAYQGLDNTHNRS